MATWSNISFQDANSPTMEQLTFFHDHTMMLIIMIMVTISYIMLSMMVNKSINRYLLHGQTIELIWTVMPAVVLMFIALPSLRILYMMDEMMNPSMTLKTIGHQWYWSYEYTDFKSIEFDSYMKPYSEMSDFRLLDVDNRVILPMNTPIRVIATSADVIHSWAVPSLGIKVDATPGRLNQAFLMIKRPGMMFGQCSEICGANHSFMPIAIESVPMKNFLHWLDKK
uniref:Cytochrome c oxidase subunit 2 n=1 Tax=Neuroctenus yunnanensis TaxID=2813420 RepID=A0A8T9W3Y6_9HEMI|nr:cytochrome c oxidase subunit II [Neuroctenus yunnanensis]YP_010990152.1 cytochrome c oxidase subunit II [Neuroctenus taiwanicus]UPI55392.1 cytochrome c oxidase subunit II [Neuroctenus yunnanensis]WOW95748.1 cytochrome c oxidase subunit 2 [Neuroctenus taiwanicus]